MVKLDYIQYGDTIEFMRSLPDGCADLIIADPPYNLNKEFEKYKDFDEWHQWSKKWIAEASRLLAPKANFFVYAIHHYACYLQCFLYECGLTYRRQLIWHYENGWSRYTNAPACHYEPLLWFARSGDSTYHVIREPYKSTERLKHKITKGGKVWMPNPEGKQAGDVWGFPTLAGRRFAKERTEHPTQKPLSLTNRIVNHFSNAGDLVLVPFVGSGTECVSAVLNGRHYLGAENNVTYARIAESRLQEILIAPSAHD
jgi:DNA modification methylase